MKRFSIALLMKIVFLVAVDIALVRASWNVPGYLSVIFVITLPMMNLLLLCLRRARRGQDARPFWLGFEAGGWGMVLLVSSFTSMFPEFFLFPLNWLRDHIYSPQSPVKLVILITFAVVAYTIPQLLVATLVGRLSTRYRVVVAIERRLTALGPAPRHTIAGEGR